VSPWICAFDKITRSFLSPDLNKQTNEQTNSLLLGFGSL